MIESLENRTEKEIKEIYDLVEMEIEKLLDGIAAKTGYFATGTFILYSEPRKQCMDVDMEIQLLQTPHALDKKKVEYYMKVNPDNVLNKPILAHKHNSWYMIYDGAHRTEANRLLGHPTIKANIIIPGNK